MTLNNGSWRPWVAAVLLSWLALLALPSAARVVLDLDVTRQPVGLQDWGDYWIDRTGQSRPEQVASDAGLGWQPTRQDAVYPLTAGQALWVRFTVPPAPDTERWYLEIAYPSIDAAALFTLDSAGQWNEQRAGDSVPVFQWPVPHRHPLMPITVSAEEPRRYLLRLQHSHSFGPPLSFVSESHVNRTEQRVSLVLGTFFGLMGLAVLVAIPSAISLRDNAYGWFAAHVGLMAMTQAAATGIGGLHLWPTLAWWNDRAPFMLCMGMLACLLMFISALVSIEERSKALLRLIQGLTLTTVALALAMLLLDGGVRAMLLAVWISTCVATSFLVVIWAWRRGDRFAPWLLLCGLPVLISSLPGVARMLGLLPVSFATLHGLQVGMAVQLPFLLLILMLRSADRRENLRRLQGLDRTDPATGLINSHVFAERLVQMIARSQRLRHRSAVLLVDVVNLDQIQRDFDRRSAEELPLRVAGRLLTAAREIDSVARLSERRFGLLVEGPLTPEEAAQAGPRVVARGLMPFKGKPVEWVAQLRVAQALLPLDGTDVPALLERLGAVLSRVPADSKRAVFSIND